MKTFYGAIFVYGMDSSTIIAIMSEMSVRRGNATIPQRYELVDAGIVASKICRSLIQDSKIFRSKTVREVFVKQAQLPILFTKPWVYNC